MAKRLAKKQPDILRYEELEQRILFSADVAPGLQTDDADGPALTEDVSADAPTDSEAASATTAGAALETRRELVIVNSNVTDYQQLIADLQGSENNETYQIVLLDAERDGIEQLNNVLDQYSGLSAVHVITHGSDGQINLGSSWLNAQTLEQNSSAVAAWGDALSADGDILFYGCNIAIDGDGRSLLDRISELTGADVAASDDETGHIDLGGDWSLEYTSGSIETRVAITGTAQDNWQHRLATTYESYEPDFSELSDTGYQIKSGTSWGQTFQHNSGNGSYVADAVDLVLSKDAGADSGQIITVSLRDSWNGTILGSAGISSDDLTTAEAWYRFDIGDVTLADNTSYVIQVESSGTGLVYLGVDDATSTYANGDLIDSSGAPVSGKDFAFRIMDDKDAPVLSGANDMAPINEDNVSNGGTLIADLISGQVSDADSGALSGIAVIAVDDTNGTWQYTTNGVDWLAFGTVDSTSAVLLAADATTSVRFVPNADWNGTVSDGITFHAWDQTSGVNGGTANLNPPTVQTVRDEFNSVAYSGNDGTASWTSDWQELGEADGASLGHVEVRTAGSVVEGPYLAIDLSILGTGISRQVDLSSATSATLSFVYEQNTSSAGGQIVLEAFDGVSWNTLQTYNINSDFYVGTVGVSQSFDISAYADATSKIRFRTTEAATGDEIYLDNLQIEYTSGLGTGGSTAFSTETASSSITVAPVTDAFTDTLMTDEDTPGSLNVLANDSFAPGWTLASVTQGTYGGVSFLADGTVTYTPNADFYGSDSFTYTVTTVAGDTETGTVTVTVNPVADVVDDALVTDEDNPVSFNVLANDIFAGSPIVTAATQGTNGSVSFLPDGTVTYTPNTNYFGSDSFTYTVTSGGVTETATVNVTINPVNDPPAITSNGGGDTAAVNIAEHSTAVTTVTAADVDGDILTYSITGGADAALFQIDGASGALSFIAAPDFEDPADADLDNIYDVTVQVSDGKGGSDSQAISVAVTDINDAPQTDNIAASGLLNAPSITVVLSGSDVDSGGSVDFFRLSSLPANGTLYTDAALSVAAATGVDYAAAGNQLSLYFVPATDWSGVTSFSFSARDNTGFLDPTPATAVINVLNYNQAPVLSGSNDLTPINEDDYTNGGTRVAELISGQISDANPADLQGIAVYAVDDSNGTWQYSLDGGGGWFDFGGVDATAARLLNADANTYVRFVPNADWNGTVVDGLSFRAWDQTSGVSGGTVDLTTITRVVADSFSSVAYNNNDGTAFWTTDWIDSIDSDPAAGTVQISAGQLVFQKDKPTLDEISREADLSGATSATLSFDYDNLLGNNADVSLSISDDGGVTYTDLAVFSTTQNQGAGTYSTDISAFISANTRIRLSADLTSASGTLSIDDLRIVFTGPNYGGTTAFSAETAACDIIVHPVNDAPVITSNGGGDTAAISIPENQAVVTTVTATDVDGDSLSYSIVGGTDAGRFSINTLTGELSFNPAPDYEAPTDSDGNNIYQVTVKATDGSLSDTQVLTITVTNLNDNDPIITSNGGGPSAAISVTENVTGAIANVDATDADGDGLTFQVIGGVDAARFEIDPATGLLTFLSPPNYEAPADADGNNVYEVIVAATDGSRSDTQFITITVTDINDAPVLDNTGDMHMTTVLENHINNDGDRISDIIASAGGDRISDEDFGAVEGIAVIAVDDTFGTWQYSLDDGASWNSFGSVNDLGAVVLSVDDLVRFSPNSNSSGTSSFSFRAWDGTDGHVSGDTAVNSSINGDATAFSTAIETARIEITALEIRMLVSTSGDVIGSGTPNLQNWTAGTILGIADPGMQFEDGDPSTLSYGTFTALVNLDDFAADNDVNITSLHYVSAPVTIGSGALSVDLLKGDILFVTENAETLTSTNSLSYNVSDIIAYRPDEFGNYSSGTFIHVLDNPTTNRLTGFSVVQSDTVVGDVTLAAGTVLYTYDGEQGNNIFHFTADTAGAGTTSGTSSILIDGVDINMGVGNSNKLIGMVLVSEDMSLNGAYVPAGSIITSVANNDNDLGDNSISATRDDFYYLTVYTTGEGTTTADATILYEGADVGLDGVNVKKMDALTFVVETPGSNLDPKIFNTDPMLVYRENDPATVIDGSSFFVTDGDSANFDGGMLSVGLGASGTLNDVLSIAHQGFAAGQIGVIGNLVFYSNTLMGSFTGGTNGVPLSVTLTTGATSSSVQGLLRSITYQNLSDNPDTSTRTVSFQMTDGDGGTSNTATATIDLLAVNDAPDGTDTTVTTLEDTDYVFAAADFGFTDIEGHNLQSVTISSLPAIGTLTNGGVEVVAGQSISIADINAGLLVYIPVPDHNGAAAASFTFQVCDDGGLANGGVDKDGTPNTITIDITPVADIVDDTATTAEDTAVTTDVLFNDTFEGTPVVTAVTQGANGSVTINADNTVTYTPDDDFNGTDSYTYTVTSGGVTETATVNVTVTPVADIAPDTATTAEDTSVTIDVLANDTFQGVYGTDYAVTSTTAPGNGSVIIEADGRITYTPVADYNGVDSFDYTVTVYNADGSTTETTTVSLTINAVIDIADDTATTAEDTPVTSNLLSNDSFDNAGRTITAVTNGANGTVTIIDAALGTVEYTPDADFNGTDTYTYTVTSGGVTETATVNVTVTPVADIAADSATTAEDTSVTIDVLANDTFQGVYGTDYAVTSTTAPSNGSVVIETDGRITYTPVADYNGTDSFDYTVTVYNADGSTTTETATVSLTVNAVVDIADDTATTAEDTAVTTTVLANDTFEGTPVVTAVTQGANGTVTINADNTVTYTPDADFNGSDFYTYTVTSGGVTETATVNVTVTPV
ncbi:MAG: tandem-95 repeat protein, partial [Desulfuromonadales bacterium]|nr:tandem-95 repeat protein [Desulfuromonadales bacterium]